MNLVYIQTANQGWHQLLLLAALRVFSVAQFHPPLTLIHRLCGEGQGGGHRHLEAVDLPSDCTHAPPTPNIQSGGSLCDL